MPTGVGEVWEEGEERGGVILHRSPGVPDGREVGVRGRVAHAARRSNAAPAFQPEPVSEHGVGEGVADRACAGAAIREEALRLDARNGLQDAVVRPTVVGVKTDEPGNGHQITLVG